MYFWIGVSFLSAAVQILAYFFYYRKVVIGRIIPNASSWSIWAFGAILETITYIFVTGDWVKNILPISCALSVAVLFVLCLKKSYFSKLSKFEWLILAMDCVAILVWAYYSSAVYANILLVFIAVFSFVPIIIQVAKKPETEHALPWYMWTFAYFLLTIVVVVRLNSWEELIYPSVFLIMHFVVAVLSTDSIEFAKLTTSLNNK